MSKIILFSLLFSYQVFSSSLIPANVNFSKSTVKTIFTKLKQIESINIENGLSCQNSIFNNELSEYIKLLKQQIGILDLVLESYHNGVCLYSFSELKASKKLKEIIYTKVFQNNRTVINDVENEFRLLELKTSGKSFELYKTSKMYWRKAQEFSAKENNCNDKEFLDIAQIREQLDSLLVVLKYMNKK